MKNDPLNIAYITSSSYSGSTLLALVLNTHPEIATTSEIAQPGVIAADPNFKCSCGAPIRTCPFFTALEEALRSERLTFSIEDMDMLLVLHDNERINRLLSEKIRFSESSTLERVRDAIVNLIPKYRHEKDRIHKRTSAYIRAVLRLQDASVYLDGNKSPYRMRFLNERHNVKAIYLYKNGIAGVYSYISNAWRRHRWSISVESASHRWFSEQITILRSLRFLATRDVIQISYSELCRDANATAGKIFSFLELDPVLVDSLDRVPHHIIGNRMRLTATNEIREREGWKKKMTAADLDVYRSVYTQYAHKLASLSREMVTNVWH